MDMQYERFADLMAVLWTGVLVIDSSSAAVNSKEGNAAELLSCPYTPVDGNYMRFAKVATLYVLMDIHPVLIAYASVRTRSEWAGKIS